LWLLAQLAWTLVLLAALAYLALYFGLNHPKVQRAILDEVHQALPGEIAFSLMEWGPLPWTLRFEDVVITADDEPVITARHVYAELDLTALARSVFAVLVDGRGFHLELARADLDDYSCALVFHPDGHLELVDAFTEREDEEEPEPESLEDEDVFSMHIGAVTGRDGRVRIDFPEWGGWAQGIDVFASLHLDDGDLVIRAPVVSAVEGEIRVGDDGDPVVFPFTDLRVTDYLFDHLFERFGGVRFETQGVTVTGEGHLATDDLTRRSDMEARLVVPPDAPGLLRWLGDHGRPLEPLILEWRLFGPLAEPTMAVSAEAFSATTRYAEGRVDVDAFRALWLLADQGSVVTLPWLSLAGEQVPRVEIDALRFALEDLELEAIVSLSPLRREWIELSLPSELDRFESLAGRVQVSGRLPLGETCGNRVELLADLALEPDTSLSFAAAWDGRVAELAHAELRVGHDQVQLDGRVDLEARTLRARSTGSVRDLRRVIRELGLELDLPVAGGLDWRVEAEGPWRLPDVEADLTGRHVTLGAWELGGLKLAAHLERCPGATARAACGLDQARLDVSRIEVDGPLGRLDARGRVWLTDELLPREVALDHLRASVSELTALWPALPLRARVDLSSDGLRVDLDAPTRSFEGGLRVDARDLRFAGEALDELSARLERRGGATLVLDRLRARRGGKTLLSGAVELDPRALTLGGRLSLGPVPVGALPFLSTLPLPIAGRVSARLALAGTLSAPRVTGALELDDWRVRPPGGIELSGAHARVALAGSWEEGLHLSSDDLLAGLSLDGQSVVHPRGYDLFMSASGLRPLRYLLDRDAVPLAVELSGTFRVSGRFDDEGLPYMVLGHIPSGALSVTFLDDVRSLENDEETVFGVSPDGLFLHRFGLAGPGASLALCGEIGADGLLDLEADASLDFESVPFLREVLVERGGRLYTAAADDDGGARGSCLPRGRSLRLHGRLADPTVSGGLVMEDLLLRPRSFAEPILLTGRTRILIEQHGEEQWARVDPDVPLRGVLEGGAFEISGSARFRELSFTGARLALSGDNLPYTMPGVVDVTANPKLVFTAEPEGDEPYLLSGELLLVSGLFHKDFDRLRQMLTTLIGERRTTYSRPLEENLPFLNDLHLDVRILSSDFEVQSRLPFGETDMTLLLDLRLGGTYLQPRLTDRVQIVPGSTVSYSIVKRDFEVTRGTIDFDGDLSAPRLDIRAKTEIDYIRQESLVPTEGALYADDEREETVTVVVALEGVPPDIDFELSSDQAEFDDEDLQYLLLTGSPKRSGQGSNLVGDLSIGLLTEDLIKTLSGYFLAPFLDRVSLGFTAEGGVNADLMTRLGRKVQLRTRVLQQGTDLRYSAGFMLRISDRLSLDGRMKVVDVEGFQSRTYEAKMRYRIPLD
jgi:hypothetical protein